MVSPKDFKAVWIANQADLEDVVDRAVAEAYNHYTGSDVVELDWPLVGGNNLSIQAVVDYLVSRGFAAYFNHNFETIEVDIASS